MARAYASVTARRAAWRGTDQEEEEEEEDDDDVNDQGGEVITVSHAAHTFAKVMADDTLRRELEEYMVQEMSEESILAHEAITAFERRYDSMSGDYMLRLAKRITATYLVDGAPMQTNLPGWVVRSVTEALARADSEARFPVDRHLFKETRREIEHLITRGSLHRFLLYRRQQRGTSSSTSGAAANVPPAVRGRRRRSRDGGDGDDARGRGGGLFSKVDHQGTSSSANNNNNNNNANHQAALASSEEETSTSWAWAATAVV